jgi:hypothetical protein
MNVLNIGGPIKMKPEEINVAIGKSLGWTSYQSGIGDYLVWTNPKSGLSSRELPNFYKDLNAIHEAEEMIADGIQTYIYSFNLARLTGERFEWKATAPQRCEAFLKTIGKWVETKE